MLVEAQPESRADEKPTLLRVQCPVDVHKKSILDKLFDWRFGLDRLLRMKMNVQDPSPQITTLLSIVEKFAVKEPLFRHRLHAVITVNVIHGLIPRREKLKC